MKVKNQRKAPKPKEIKNKRQREEEEKVEILCNGREPSPSVRLPPNGKGKRQKALKNNASSVPLTKNKEGKEANSVPIPQCEEDTIRVQWKRTEHQIRLESKLLLECINENEEHVEKLLKNKKELKAKDKLIKDLSNKVSHLERVLNEATESIANINTRYEKNEEKKHEKKRDAKEASLRGLSTVTLKYTNSKDNEPTNAEGEISFDTDRFEAFKVRHIKEEIKKAHIERPRRRDSNMSLFLPQSPRSILRLGR